ncbi:MAG: hypothetical protein EA378_08865 [Phycisphaerales bacterium]|nr:MAG: hypothetical protein EA378_08865 [Phycisphaerales bacterium]
MPPVWFFIVFGVVAVALIVFESIRYHRKVARKRREALEAAGFEVFDRMKKADKHECFTPFEHITPRLRTGHKGLKWFAIGLPQARIDPTLRPRLFNHSYTASSGRSSQTYHHTIAAFPCPPYWPELRLEPTNTLNRFFRNLIATGKPPLELEDPEFTKRWRITTDDPDFALLCLTPQIQAFINTLPGAHKTDSWWIARGWICCLRMTNIRKHDELIAFSDHPADLFAQIPIEFAYYNAP